MHSGVVGKVIGDELSLVFTLAPPPPTRSGRVGRVRLGWVGVGLFGLGRVSRVGLGWVRFGRVGRVGSGRVGQVGW